MNRALTFFLSLFITFSTISINKAQDVTEITWTNIELEKAISDSLINGQPIKLPAKVILDKPIILGLKSNLVFSGGGGRLLNHNQANVKNRTGGTRIFWKGASTDSIFITSGVGNVWEHMVFVLDNPVVACIHVTKGSGLGTGKMVIDSCSFIENPIAKQKSIGLLMGVNVRDGNCDESVMQNCISLDMKSLFESRNNQSVGNRFYNNHSIRNLNTFNFKAGGKVAIFGHSCVSDNNIIKLGEQGSGNNSFFMYGLSVDNNAPADWKLIDNTLNRDIFVTVEGMMSNNSQGTRNSLIINDNSRFNLDALIGIRAEVVR